MWRRIQFFLLEATAKDVSYHAFSYLRNFARKVQVSFFRLNWAREKLFGTTNKMWTNWFFCWKTEKKTEKTRSFSYRLKREKLLVNYVPTFWSSYGKNWFYLLFPSVFSERHPLSKETTVAAHWWKGCPFALKENMLKHLFNIPSILSFRKDQHEQ